MAAQDSTAVQEIPVEVVIEQPPPKPKPPEDKPKPPPQQDLEKPAYDAPAAPTKEKVNRQSPDKTTEAKATPEAPPPTNPGAPPAESPAPEPKPADQQKMRPAPPAHDLTPEPEGELPADTNPKPEDNPAQAAAPPRRRRTKRRSGRRYRQLRTCRNTSSHARSKKSPVAGGNAETRYLTIVYGKIKAHLHETPDLHLDLANRHGIVDFYIDEGGNLVGRKLVSTSGSQNLDIAVMTAIAEAAPYPAPPNWSPISLNYTNFGRAPTQDSRGH